MPIDPTTGAAVLLAAVVILTILRYSIKSARGESDTDDGASGIVRSEGRDVDTSSDSPESESDTSIESVVSRSNQGASPSLEETTDPQTTQNQDSETRVFVGDQETENGPEEILQCPECDETVPEDSHFCSSCGGLLVDEGKLALVVNGEVLIVEYGTPVGRKRIRRTLVPDGISEVRAQQVSREHVVFKRENGSTFVQDLDSTNGTSLDGRELESETWVPLQSGVPLELAGVLTTTVYYPDD